MEERHVNLLKQHRNKFVQSVSKVELLYPMLHRYLSPDDILEIERYGSNQQGKVAKLLDILPNKGSQVFSSLCVALETTYPHLLTVMFLGSHSQYNYSTMDRYGSSQSTVSSYTSESDIEDHKNPHFGLSPQNGLQENGASGGTSNDNSLSRLDASPQSRNYEQLQRDCQKAMINLDVLRSQHSDVSKKCDQALKEVEFYRRQNRAAVNNGDTLRSELQTLKQEYAELSTERNRAQQEIIDLRQLREDDSQNIDELQRQNREIMNHTASSETLKKMYDTTLNHNDKVKKENDSLRKRYADLMSEHSLCVNKLETTNEEKRRLQAVNDSLQDERKESQEKFASLTTQCTAFIHKYDMASRERDSALRDKVKANDKFTKTLKEANHMKKIKQDLENDFKRVSKERDAAIREYTLVMSERDVVHKDIEKLQNEVEVEQKRRKAAEEDCRHLQIINKQLEHKLDKICEERDSVLREWHELTDCYRDMINSTVQVQQERDKALREFEKYKDERDVARRERTEALDQRDQLLQEYYITAQQQKSMCNEYDQVNKEMESLRREVATLTRDLKEMSKEAESAKQQREFAFSERDKIVQERESVRTLCDKLRRDRDRAVSDYAEALRQSDDIKRQKNDICKQLKEIREKVNIQAEKECRMKQLIAHQSRDSAIGDAGSQEWETETVEFETERDDQDVSRLGFDIGDSKDNPHIPEECTLVITKVDKGSLADGRLKVNDCVVKVNNIDLTHVGDRMVALEAVKNSRGVLNMVVKRRRMPGARQCTVKLFLSSKDHGIIMESGIFIRRIMLGSLAAKEGCLFAGDRIMSVNGISVENQSVIEVEKLLENQNNLMLNVVRITAPMSSSGIPSSASPTVDSYKSHETSSSKSSLTHLLSPNEFTSSEGEGKMMMIKGAKQTESKRNSWGSSREESSYDEFSNSHEWKVVAKDSPQYTSAKDSSQFTSAKDSSQYTSAKDSPQYSSQRGHSEHRNDNPVWEERKDTGSVRRRSHDRFGSPQYKSNDFNQRSHRDSFESSPSRHSLKEPKRHSFHQSQSSADAREKRQSAPVTISDHDQRLRVGGKEKLSPGRSPEHGPPGYVDPPPAHMNKRGSPRFEPFTEHRRKSKSSRSEINRTWPKVRDPPEFVQNLRDKTGSHRVKKKTKRKTIPIMSPSIDSMSADEENDDDDSELVPPIPPHRTSSFRAWRQQTPVVAESPTEATPPKLPPKISVSSQNSSSPEHGSPKKLKPDINVGDNSLSAMHYATTSLPATNVDFDSVSGNATFRPISTPSIPEQAKNTSAMQTQRPNQLEVAQYYSPRQNVHMRRTPSPGHYDRRRNGSRSSTESMSGLPATCQPSDAMLVRLRNHVPYYTVVSQPLANQRQSAIPGFPRTHPRGPRNSLHSLSSEDDPSRTPSRNSLPEWRFSPGPDMHHSIEFDPLAIPDGYHRSLPPGYDPGPNGYNSLPIPHNKRFRKTSSRASPGSAGLSNSSLEKGPGSVTLSISSSGERDSPLSPGSVGSFTKITEPVVHITPGDNPDDPRSIKIERSTEPLGITINENNGGIFIQSVQPESLASRAKLKIGDQILEFNGINLRRCNYEQAALIISKAGTSINIRVQYKKLSPDPKRDSVYSSNHSTPVATPTSTRTNSPSFASRPTSEIMSDTGTMTPPTPRVSRIRTYSTNSGEDSPVIPASEQPRFVFMKKSQPTGNIGVKFFGGNHLGIFISEIQHDSIASEVDIRVGDQVLELNGFNMREATAEQATTELQKTTDDVHILAQFNIARFNQIQGRHGDALFVRAMTDYSADNDNELTFKKEDILYIEETMCNGVIGMWSAWLLDTDGQKTVRGQIPSKTKLEKELARRRSITEGLQEEELRTASSRRREGAARRSFFRRKNKHQRNNSKDSRELSDASIGDVPIQEENILPTYQRVDRLDFHNKRPVLLLGPLADKVSAKLTEESTEKFLRCAPQIVKSSIQNMEKDLADNVYLDYQRRDSHFECIPNDKIKEICKKNCHCILEGIPPTICKERLGILQLYPIIIFIKFKSAKQIREQKDPFFLPERLTNRQAKDLFEFANKMEQEYKPHFDETVNGGNLASICTKVKHVIDREQHKANFIPSKFTL